ncbi:MAG: M23 family metallopeptidase [Candidatus Aenigmarchaeota archaeon]|nr:M23 family metallopeptidase [Candidatus Aenigmarchaeota archaeon]
MINYSSVCNAIQVAISANNGKAGSSAYWQICHANFPESKYAVDFLLPLGTPVLAARRGSVVLAKHESDLYIGLADMERMTDEELQAFVAAHTNVVCIAHGDGTYAEYAHLDREAVVHKGQSVEQGDITGYCGMSGATTTPHLHFNVFRMKGKQARSIPVVFEA